MRIHISKRTIIILVAILAILLLVGCLPSASHSSRGPAGFLSGIWHGWLAPLSLILGIFNNNIASTKPITRAGGMISVSTWP